jgi:radical SAM superfamily enzyme YgiQ (UPF0313 family)
MSKRKFLIVLIKPSHYDDDGYVIQWRRSTIPSNSLASVYGLLSQCAEEQALGPDVEIEIEVFDECNTIIDVASIARRIQSACGGFVALVGVQSNQFPRALDLGRQFRARGLPVAVGGFHVSGCIAMLPELPPELIEAQRLGMILFAGEGEGRLADLLRDIDAGAAKPLYNYLDDMPDMAAAAIPVLPRHVVTKVAGHYASFDAGRGCPYQCSFCTIINVQGRKSRRRSPDDIEAIVRANLAQGVHRFFITDDNFARNKDWEPILDRLIRLREDDGFKMSFVIQVDTLCHRLPRFVEKCGRAGVKRVFIGLENINPESLIGAKKRQNKITEYRKMLLAWKAVGAVTYCGYILGFPADTEASIRRDIEIIQRELPVDLLEFFYLTPLPGSEDHKKLYLAGVPMDGDLNKYDLNHATTAHPLMSKTEWERAYRTAWESYYSDRHIETVLRRAAASRQMSPGNVCFLIVWFKGCIEIERIHPLEGGFLRMKFRRDRRPGLPLEPAWRFYPRYWAETCWKELRWAALWVRMRAIYVRKVKHDPHRYQYMDAALSPIDADETEKRALFDSDAAKAYVRQEQRLEKLRHGEAA